MFANELDWRKWISTVADLIEVKKKKVRIFCIKKWNFLFCSDFFIWKVIDVIWKSKNVWIDFEKKNFETLQSPVHLQSGPNANIALEAGFTNVPHPNNCLWCLRTPSPLFLAWDYSHFFFIWIIWSTLTVRCIIEQYMVTESSCTSLLVPYISFSNSKRGATLGLAIRMLNVYLRVIIILFIFVLLFLSIFTEHYWIFMKPNFICNFCVSFVLTCEIVYIYKKRDNKKPLRVWVKHFLKIFLHPK